MRCTVKLVADQLPASVRARYSGFKSNWVNRSGTLVCMVLKSISECMNRLLQGELD